MMDAVKILLEFDRMCRSCQGCAGCPAIAVCDCSEESKEELKQLVGIVEKRSKDHPQKTRLDDFKEKYPNALMKQGDCPRSCAKDLGYCEKCLCINGLICDCKECWNTPMEE